MRPWPTASTAAANPTWATTNPIPWAWSRAKIRARTLNWLAFTGESLFNQMGAGYRSNTVYVINEEENSQLPPGLHYTQDDGATWGTSAAQGIRAVTLQVAVHQ
ncbi:MAG: hypothetical protein R2838_10650 [Caldilineaceae bacterium]